MINMRSILEGDLCCTIKSSNDNTNLGRFVNNHKNRPSAEIFEFEIRAVMGADDFDKYVLLGGRKRKSLHVV